MGTKTFFAILRKLFGLPPGYVAAGKSLGQLTPVYRRWELYSLFIWFCCMPLLAAAWWWLFYWIGNWNAQRFAGAVYQLCPMGMTWGVSAIMAGILTTSLPLTLFYRFGLRERYAEFQRYLNLRHGCNERSIGLPICVFFGAIILASVVLILHWRVVLTNTEIVQYPFFTLLSVSHKYSDITDIRTAPRRQAPSGNLRDNDDYETEFSDGSVWATYPNPADLTADEKQRMMEFVSKRSGKPIRHVALLERS